MHRRATTQAWVTLKVWTVPLRVWAARLMLPQPWLVAACLGRGWLLSPHPAGLVAGTGRVTPDP